MKSGVTKQELISSLETTLKLTREPIERLELVSEDKVIIHFKGGVLPVNIHCDSGMAIIRDVAKAINY
ncbi:MAG TPA: hypothetical protein VJ888_02130 [Mobilitalea sp.]|nr:hypothetical protein [Mobilitalea sp.]